MKRDRLPHCADDSVEGLSGRGAVLSSPTGPQKNESSQKQAPLILRPYQLLCTVCSLGKESREEIKGRAAEEGKEEKKGKGGEESAEQAKQYEKYNHILNAVRKNPDMPITLACSAGDLYAYQDSGTDDDTPESDEFNRKRDLDILQILDLAPGSTLPARTLFSTLLKGVRTVSGICGYGTVTGEAWEGCPKAESGNYERGYEKAAREIWFSQLSNAFDTPRTEEEMALDKQKSLEALYSADVVTIRPHILVCAICQYGEGLRPPFKEDNLPELIDLIINKNPNILLRMAKGADWMMCAPCPARNTELNCCTHVNGCGELDSQKRDLDLLQKLGLKFGSMMKARELYRLIFERISTTHGIPDICLKYNTMPSIWWDYCSGYLYQANPGAKYIKGRRELIKKFKL